MRSRHGANGDPTTKRWNASIRLANFASLEENPLCVGCFFFVSISFDLYSEPRQMSAVGALLDHLVRERALGDFDADGIRGLDVRDIEILAL